MKVIDILNKIANGERTPNFKYKDDRFSQFNTSIHNDTDGKWVEVRTGIDDWEDIGYSFLNDEVEIIEEDKKIEKLEKDRYISGSLDGKSHWEEEYTLENIGNKINEIIDYLNKEEE